MIPKQINDCPFCESNAITLTKKPYVHKEKKLKGMWWYYECRDCKEGFTTTESDTISQKGLIKI